MKTLNNSTEDQAKDQISDLELWGLPNMWKLISKASSKKEGWMKSTKAMVCEHGGVLVQVTTQQGDNISEALTYVPNMYIYEHTDKNNNVIGRYLNANPI